MHSRGEVVAMEIPLPVLFPPVCTSVLEDENDDVPPSPTPDPVSPSLTSGTFFQRGFVDCAEEAIRFLVEEEGMPEDSPVIAGLKQHLVRSTQEFTPASLAPSSPTFFTFPSPSSGGGVMRNKHLISSSSLSVSHTSAHSDNVRFAPYTVASHRTASSRHTRTVAEKDSSVTSRQTVASHVELKSPSSSCSLTRSLDNVLRDDLISTDDLHGVLRCLQSVQSPSIFQQPLQQASIVHPSAHMSSPICHQSEHSVHPCTVSNKSTTSSGSCQSTESCLGDSLSSKAAIGSLNDSGVSVDLPDEVDGQIPYTLEDVFHSCSNTDSVVAGCEMDNASVTDFEEQEKKLCNSSSNSVPSNFSASSVPLSTSASSESSSAVTSSSLTSSIDSSPFSPSLVASSTVQTPVPVVTAPDSNPSSQLSLLSSLSSGTHRLTAQSGDGSATAVRIQSLANEILLLLQEEAEADEEDDESDEDEDDNDDGNVDDSDEDSAVEMEP